MSVFSQTNLYDIEPDTLVPSPLPFFHSTHEINLDFDAIKAFPETIQLILLDDNPVIITKDIFIPRSGYQFRDDETDPLGTPPFLIDPLAQRSDFSFMWSGSNNEYDVVITTYKGLLSATISGTAGRYVVSKRGTKYKLTHVNLAGFPSYEGDTFGLTNRHTTEKTINEDVKYQPPTQLKSFNYQSKNIQQRDTNNPNVVDILIVYNEAVRLEAGGSPSNPNDTLGIEQKIIAEIDNLNTTLSNSQNTTRVTKFHTALVSDFEMAPGVNQGNQTFNNFLALQSVKNLRNQVGADVVSGILETDFISFQYCGLANGHTSNLANQWTIGAGFSEYAYNITSMGCILYDNTFTHEFGHLLGTQHVRDEPFTPVAEVVANGFPYAFGYRNGSFKSVMSTTQNTTARRLNFSNPNVVVGGQITGVGNFAHNQRVIDELTVFATNYRQRPDVIFISGFE